MTDPERVPLHLLEGVNPGPARDEWEATYRREVNGIYRFIFSRTGNKHDAEDLCAQVFLRALPHLDPDQGDAAMRGYLYTTARNLIGDHWTERHRVCPFDEADAVTVTVATAEPDPDDESRVATLLTALSDREREVLELRFLRGYTVDETATALGISGGNCKVIQHRALKRVAASETYR